MLLAACLWISVCRACRTVWASVGYTDSISVLDILSHARSSVARVSQVSCHGVFPQAPACTHDAGFLCNLKLFCYSSSAVTKGRKSTDIALEQEAGRDPLCVWVLLRDCFPAWGEVFLQCETLQGYAMRGALSVEVESLSHKRVRSWYAVKGI